MQGSHCRARAPPRKECERDFVANAASDKAGAWKRASRRVMVTLMGLENVSWFGANAQGSLLENGTGRPYERGSLQGPGGPPRAHPCLATCPRCKGRPKVSRR